MLMLHTHAFEINSSLGNEMLALGLEVRLHCRQCIEYSQQLRISRELGQCCSQLIPHSNQQVDNIAMRMVIVCALALELEA